MCEHEEALEQSKRVPVAITDREHMGCPTCKDMSDMFHTCKDNWNAAILAMIKSLGSDESNSAMRQKLVNLATSITNASAKRGN